MGVSAFIAKRCFKKTKISPRPLLWLLPRRGKNGGEAEGGSASASELIMKVSGTRWLATSAAVSEEAPPVARLLSQPWNCIFPFHSDTCWEQLSGDSPAALLGKGLSSENEGSTAIRQIDSPPFLTDWARLLSEGKRMSAAWLMLRNTPHEQPLRQDTGASSVGLQEKGVKNTRGLFACRGPNLAHVARRWKQGWIFLLCRSWKVLWKER